MKLLLLWIFSLEFIIQSFAAFAFKKNLSILDSFVNVSKKDAFDVEITAKLITRGKYALSGYYDMKIELDDRQKFELKISYNPRTASNYKKVLFAFPINTLTAWVNGPYKEALMDTLQLCNTKFLHFKDFWLPPLKPFRADMNKCNISIDILPAYLPNGYYKLIFIGSGIVDLMLDMTVLLD